MQQRLSIGSVEDRGSCSLVEKQLRQSEIDLDSVGLPLHRLALLVDFEELRDRELEGRSGVRPGIQDCRALGRRILGVVERGTQIVLLEVEMLSERAIILHLLAAGKRR